MLRRTSLIIGTVILLASASLAQAQGERTKQGGQRPGGQGGPGGPGGGGITGLLAMTEVQKELEVTSEQKGLIEDMVKDLRSAGGGFDFQGLRDLSREEREKRMEEFRKQGEERAKKAEEMAKMILEPNQFDRLSQLRIQNEGVRSLDRTDVAEKLGLTQEQKDKIRKIRDESRTERGGFGGGQNQSREERQKAFDEAREKREKADASVIAVLTSPQKETWEKMQGKKFAFPQPQGRRPGGGN